MAKSTTTSGKVRRERRVIERPRLLKLLDEGSPRTMLLIAPAGYGKTTLAQQWATRHDPCIWYRCDLSSIDVAALAAGLTRAADAIIDDCSRPVRDYLRASYRSGDEAILEDVVLDALAEWPEAATLVIDDLQMINDSPPALRLMHACVDSIPGRVLIAGRERPPWISSREILYGEALQLAATDLSMTESEARSVLGKRGKRFTSRMLERAGGWPALVGLASAADLDSLPDAVAAELHEYVAHEVFAAFSETTQEGLKLLALAPVLTDELIGQLCGSEAVTIIDEAGQNGFLTRTGANVLAMHPLLRSLLRGSREDLAARRGRADRVAGVLMRQGDWDAALEIAREHHLDSKLVELLRMTGPLLRAGRTATLSSLLGEVRKFEPLSAEADVIEAELDFRQGRYDRARRLAERAAKRLGEADELRSRALFRSGQCAHSLEDIDPALALFRQARSAALTSSDMSDALWGELVCALYAEHPSASELLSDFAALKHETPDYYVRLATAHLTWSAVSGTELDVAISEAADLGDLTSLADPMVRCSFLQAHAACCAINGRYDDAARSARSLQTDGRVARLGFVRGIADLRLAAAHIGLHQYARAAARLDNVAAREPDDRFIVATAAAARIRLAAIQRNNPPPAFLAVDLTKLADAPRGEYFASVALFHASRADLDSSHHFVSQALQASRSNETRAYAAAARAIRAVRGAKEESAVETFNATLCETLVFDALVCAYRIAPGVLLKLMEAGLPVQQVASVLRRAHDFHLAKTIGIELGRSAVPGEAGLTRRERDVLELIEEGLSNKEIAQRLFISQATAKVHVRHIFAKLGVRSRTEAALHAQASREP